MTTTAMIRSAVLVGTAARPVTVEVQAANGVPRFSVVGRAEAVANETRDRVRAAIAASGFPWPLQRVTVNVAAPGSVGPSPGLDLPIAIGVLVCTGLVSTAVVEGRGFVGQLGLDGSVLEVADGAELAAAVNAARVYSPGGSVVDGDGSASSLPTLQALVVHLLDDHQEVTHPHWTVKVRREPDCTVWKILRAIGTDVLVTVHHREFRGSATLLGVPFGSIVIRPCRQAAETEPHPLELSWAGLDVIEIP